MILFSTIDFLRIELNKYLSLKLQNFHDPHVVTGNLSIVHDSSITGSADLVNRVVISLIYIEEDRISKNPDTATRTLTGVKYKNPKVLLNLYVLFSANRTDYKEALINLSYVIQFFQLNNVLNTSTHVDFPEQIEKLIPDLVSFNMEQLNQLWGILGGKHIPSVMYKIRMVTIDEGLTQTEGGLIREILTEGKNIIN